MSDDTLVCAYCGCADFTQVRTTRTEYRLRWSRAVGPMECEETVVDGGDLDEAPFACEDCGRTFEIGDEGDSDVLVPESEYNSQED